MDLFATYNSNDRDLAACKKLQIVSDYLSNIQMHLSNIKKRVLIDDDTVLSLVAAINAGFYVILYGPPGTAKSTLSSFLPVEFYGAKCNIHTADSSWNVRKVIGGITVTYDTSSAPAKELIGPKNGYIVEDILECYETRLETTDFDTAFTVIDEFNRTNMDECLGPMFTAMGADDKIIKLEYNKGFNDDLLLLKIPSGYRMICNMNKYDRTFTNELSEALSRRFKWIYIGAPESQKYSDEEHIVEEQVYQQHAGSIQPSKPITLVDIEDCKNYQLFANYVAKEIYSIINDLRTDLELGTSYKIDAIKLANHLFKLKMYTQQWGIYGINNVIQILDADSIEIVSSMVQPSFSTQVSDLVSKIIHTTIDITLAMTVIPACESLEDLDAIERTKQRFNGYAKCLSELKRMKVSV